VGRAGPVRRRRARVALALAALASACSDGAEPAWIPLAKGFRPPARGTDEGRVLELGGGWRARVVREDGELRLRARVPADAWTADEGPGRWRLDLPAVRAFPAPGDRLGELSLDAEGTTFERVRARRAEFELPPGGYRIVGRALWLALDAFEEPPADAWLSYPLTSGWVGPEGTWQVRGRRFSGAGLSLWPGERHARRFRLPRGATLRFATAAEPFSSVPDAASSVSYRVELDGRTRWEHQQEVPPEGSYAWHAVPLPPEGGPHELAFAVDGPFAYTSFLAPTVGPAEVGAPGERPFGDTRPDLVVFLADTLRADNLTLYGAPRPRAENLERFFASGVAFSRAWSVSTSTLPAHLSMFTGLYPRQCASAGLRTALTLDVTTVAELLEAHGYRTGAITDSVVVSQFYNLHQGFEWFDEHRDTLDSTLQRVRAFLDADDGRPVFLWVHTYRAHRPYVVSAETAARWGGELGLFGDEQGEELVRQLLPGAADAPGLDPDEVQRGIDSLEALYRGAVLDLDRGFGELWAELEDRGLLVNGRLVLTSDHGEAFHEHGEIFHSGRVFEEQVRIPLAVVGGGLEPRRVDEAASLVDLPPTLAALAGLAPLPRWPGRSLLELDDDRAVFAFECGPAPERSTLALVEGAHKVIVLETAAALEAERALAAFDLERDPLETLDLSDDGRTRELLGRLGPEARELLRPLVRAVGANLDEERIEELESLGYAAGD